MYILMEKKPKAKETDCGLNNGCDRSTWKGPLCIPGVGPELVLGLSTEHTLKPQLVR